MGHDPHQTGPTQLHVLPGQRPPPLSFDGIHLACLCGDNGNGKSALLDAMTWALWGKARAKSADDLIHLGQSEMEVELEFTAGKERYRYRVIRKRARGRLKQAGQTLLELQIASDGDFRSITENSMEETQKKIIGILHVDYDTFVNSAFLLQGHADEYTIKQPRQRKEVLTRILGLSAYDELEERAKNYGKEREGQGRELSGRIANIDIELAQKERYEVDLGEVQEILARLDVQAKEKEKSLTALRREKESLEHKREQLEEIERLAESRRQDLDRWKGGAGGHQARIAEYEGVLSQRQTIEEGHEQLLAARKTNDNLNERLRLQLDLNQRRNQLERVIEEAKQALLNGQKMIASRIETGEARVEKLPQLKEEIKQVQARLHELSRKEEGLEEKRRRSKELLEQIHHLESANTGLKVEMEELRGKVDLLARGEATCPLCETELGVEGRQRIEAKYTAEGRGKADRYRSNQAEMEQKRLEQGALESDVAQSETEINKGRIAGESRSTLLQKNIAEAEETARELAAERIKLEETESRLAKRDFAITEQGMLQELEKEPAAEYDAERHREVRHRLEELKGFEDLERRLAEAEKLVAQEKEALARAEEAAANLRSTLETATRKREGLAAEVSALPTLLSKLGDTEQGYQSLLEQQAREQQRLGGIRSSLERCAELESTRQEKERGLRRASEEEGIYKELAEAFGKRGIQALLIETALPEIEAEANRLLSRMTDNRMHVRIETQREARKGGTIETLDINIADELGTRSYEMFSGGEAFRIDFSLRIALSKLLARRAGAPLPTLVIDEGFGTQDSAGRERLIEAINSIQDDFEKIIVITHIEELKDVFPVRIDVTKTAEGSMVSVS
ncbi:AAA family ATPase [Chloroflexota bacterium]